MVKNSIDDLAQDFENFISSLPQEIFNFFDELLTNLKDTLSNIKDTIINLPTNIVNLIKSMLEYLFVPSDEVVNNLLELTKEKFGIVNQVVEITEDLLTITFLEEPPEFDIVFYGKAYNIVDFSMFNQYRQSIFSITLAISYFFFAIWLIHYLPGLLGGLVADNYSNYRRDNRDI